MRGFPVVLCAGRVGEVTCPRCGALCRPDRQFTVDALLLAEMPALLMRCLNGHTLLERPPVTRSEPQYTRRCLGCGGPLAPTTANQQRHPECAAIRRLALQRRSTRQARAKRRRVARSMSLGNRGAR